MLLAGLGHDEVGSAVPGEVGDEAVAVPQNDSTHSELSATRRHYGLSRLRLGGGRGQGTLSHTAKLGPRRECVKRPLTGTGS